MQWKMIETTVVEIGSYIDVVRAIQIDCYFLRGIEGRIEGF